MISVCIVNWNNRNFLRECLASLEAYPPESEELEVIVVDNASSDSSAEMVQTEFPDVQLIAMPTNTGYAEGNNSAIRRALGEFILLLNPDVRIFPGTLDTAVNVLKTRPHAGAVSVQFRNPDGTIQPSLRGFPDPKSLLYEVTGLSRLFPHNKTLGAYFMRWFDYQTEIEADQPMATFLMINRDTLLQVGELDTDFPIFFNDVDWCYRAKQLGWRIYYTPEARIVHYGGQGTKQAPKRAMVRESHRSLIRYLDKYHKASMHPLVYTLCVMAATIVGKMREINSRA
jgi:GT2 family glycosyltransferase